MQAAPEGRKRHVGLLAALAAAFAAFLVVGAGNAFAFSCDRSGDDVTITMNNETITVSKGNLSRILVNGTQCDDATASNTDHIFIEASDDDADGDNVTIDMGGGRFEPGTDDETGLNEIEWDLDWVDTLTILGNAAPDHIQIGQDGNDLYINLNGDNDADIEAWPTDEIDSLVVRGRGGNDVLSAKGGLNGDCDIPDSECADPDPLTDFGVTLDGGDGDDSIQGGEYGDVLIGGPGNDVMDGDDQEDVDEDCDVGGVQFDQDTGMVTFADSDDLDIVDYSGSAGPITVDLDPNEGHPGSATGDGTDVLQNVEGIAGSPANDTLSGDNAANALFGGGGDDTLAGDAGNDCVFGGDGNDTLDENEGTTTAQGGTGTTNGYDLLFGEAGLDDTITYSARTTRVNVFLESLNTIQQAFDDCKLEEAKNRGALGFSTLEDGADLDGDGFSGDDESDCVFLDTENVITGSGNDLISAALVNNRADNEFTANAGNDLMDGGAGNDIFHEGSASNGADDMDGGTGSDTCDYSARTNPVSVNLDSADNDGEAGEGDNCGGVVDFFGGPSISGRAAQGFLGGEGDPEAAQDVEAVWGGSGNDVLTGDDESNVLVGNAGNDTLTGNGGTDVLQGGDGDDLLNGGAGNDSLDGGAGTDTVDFGGGAAVVINMNTGTASGQGNDTITGGENASGSAGNDTIRGTSGNETLNGRGGNDTIQGLGGDDTVNGGAGSDELGGGAGNDRVNGGSGADTLRGGGGADNLNGGPANDTLMGGAGDDSLFGGAGKDDHRGGPGNDSCSPGSPGLGAGDTASSC